MVPQVLSLLHAHLAIIAELEATIAHVQHDEDSTGSGGRGRLALP